MLCEKNQELERAIIREICEGLKHSENKVPK